MKTLFWLCLHPEFECILCTCMYEWMYISSWCENVPPSSVCVSLSVLHRTSLGVNIGDVWVEKSVWEKGGSRLSDSASWQEQTQIMSDEEPSIYHLWIQYLKKDIDSGIKYQIIFKGHLLCKIHLFMSFINQHVSPLCKEILKVSGKKILSLFVLIHLYKNLSGNELIRFWPLYDVITIFWFV